MALGCRHEMRTFCLRTCLVAVVAGWSAPVAAQSQPTGWYLGGGIGRSDYVLPSDNVVLKSNEARGIGYQFFVGYRVRPFLALEAGYAHFGDTTRVLGWAPGVVGVCSINFISPCNGNVNEDVTATAYKVALVGTVPIRNRLGGFGSVGLGDIDLTRVLSQNVSQHARERKNRPFVGAGVRYGLSPVLAFRAEWEWFPGTAHAYFGSVEWQFRN